MKQIILAVLVFLLASTKSEGIERYILPCNSYLINVSRLVLLQEVGTREKTNKNNGERIAMYLKAVGLTEGSPYCMAGQYYCFLKATKILKMSEAEIPIMRTGSTVLAYNDARRRGHLTKGKPNKDDLIFWRATNTFKGHVERIIETRRAGWIVTVGFNTRSGDFGQQDEGDGVYIRKRNIYHPIGKMVFRGLIGFVSK